jgi:CLIP-associating protein 1/2
VYEEPSSPQEQTVQPSAEESTTRPPLGEINIQVDTTPQEDTDDDAVVYSKKNAKSQQSHEQISRDAAAVIDSGINRITANTLDAHGFRKLNSTISNNISALGEIKLSSLIRGVLQRLADTASPSDDRIVMQENLLLRILFQGKKDFFLRHMPEVLTNLICAISRYAEQSHVAQTLARSVLDFVRAMDRTALVTLTNLTHLLTEHELSSFGIASCLAAMDSLISQHEVHLDGDEQLLKEILTQALEASSSGEVPVRRHANGVARAACKNMGSADKFWEIFFSIEHENRTMLLYSLKYDEGIRRTSTVAN